MMSKILLADGRMFDKIEAHKKGLQHFAFSVFLFNKNNELLLQKRAKNKYHSGGLWSNTCCSHFQKKSDIKNCKKIIKKRIFEELGINLESDLTEAFIFKYNVNVGNDLIENEIDYVFKTTIDSNSVNYSLNRDEVEEIKFVDIKWLQNDLKINPEKYTKWLELIFEKNYFFDE